MSDSLTKILHRLSEADAELRELRQLFMAEMRSMRGELKALVAQQRDTGIAVDTLLAEMRLHEETEDEGTRG